MDIVVEEPVTPVKEAIVVEEPVTLETATEEPRPSELTDMVKVKVLIGTFGFDERFFEQGEVFMVSRKRAKQFPKEYVQILEE